MRIMKRGSVLFIFIAFFILISQFGSKSASATGDEYVTYDSVNHIWTMGTAAVEKIVQLNASGQFVLTSFKNKATGQEYVQGSVLSDEFSVNVGGTTYTGSSLGWVYDTYTLTTLSQGETQLIITFHNSVIKVNRYYIIYPSTGVIQQWSVIQNVSGSAQNFSDPSLFRQRVMANDVANTDFMYMTGGANFTGSQILKTVALSTAYTRTFNSQDAPEVITVDGRNILDVSDNKQGVAIYNEIFALRNRSTNSGMYLLFDYIGHWSADMGNFNGNFAMNGRVFMTNYSVANNASITTPKSMTGVFAGDLDDMGNSILNYVYTYKWDYTRSNYFGQIKVGQWIKNVPQTENIFQAINNGRYIGADSAWIDDNWYNFRGDWNNLFHDDFKAVNSYAAQNGMSFINWNPPWQVDLQSQALIQNPSYQIGSDTGTYYGYHFNLANANVVNWIRNYVNGKQAAWGAHALRYDGEPAWPSNGSENDMLAQSNNFYSILKIFKDDNPLAGIFGCSSGGETLTIETVRYSDMQQTTDGNVMHYAGYYTSLITPPDKMFHTTNSENYNWQDPYSKNNRGNLSETYIVGMGNAKAPITSADKESWRKDIELYHYFQAQGVSGRWVKVFRPTVSTGDQTYFIQKMSADNSKGYIDIRHNDAMIGSNVTVYPKGLTGAANYTVATLEGGKATTTNTGTYWMTNGIALTPLKRGEVIFLNLESRPGSGSDHTVPAAPAAAVKKQTTYIYHSGVQITWNAAADNNWISYYEIFKNSVSIDKVAKGTFYFDINGSVDDTYQVRTVDGDGNVSALSAASPTDTNPLATVYKLSTDLSSRQGGKNWSYVQWNGSSWSNMAWTGQTWNGAYTYNLIWAPAELHPDVNDSGVLWTAPAAGTIEVSGNAAKVFAGGDGVNVKILKNANQVWPGSGWQYINGADTVGYSHDIAIPVAVGDKIYFQLNKGGDNTSDETKWDPTITYASSSWTASTQFSSVQGQNNWYYDQWNGSSYSIMTWDGVSTWKGAYAYNLIWAPAQMHPDVNDTARAWKAPNSGNIVISGIAKKANVGGGDGVKVKIMKNSTQIWPVSGWQSIAAADSVGLNSNVNVSVAANDMIYFVLNKNGDNGFDETAWDPTIIYNTPAVATPLPSYNATSDFTSSKGQYNWSYKQASGASYSDMTWNIANNRWEGAFAYNIISLPDQMHPDVNDTVRSWQAPKTGTIRLTGTVKKSSSGVGGDGINVKIMKDFTQIWPASGWQFIAGTNTTGVNYDVTISVNQTNNLYFVLNRNGDNISDATSWNPSIQYTSIP